jgi:ornithine lipid hydroxylase
VLWRLHSVHHSVEQLSWLNTARFHLLEKALQMCLDSLPFLLMGVHETVLALYYLAYATNGFFQHCNIQLRYGILNYIVGSAETHRWHHSREPREANANYGNTVIVWDLLFGTWFLPEERAVSELGLKDPEFPKSFLGLLRAPFRS